MKFQKGQILLALANYEAPDRTNLITARQEYLVYYNDPDGHAVVLTDDEQFNHLEGLEDMFELVAIHTLLGGRIDIKGAKVH